MQGVKLTIVHYENILPTTTLLAGIAYFYTMCNRVKMLKSEKNGADMDSNRPPFAQQRAQLPPRRLLFCALICLDIFLIV